MCFHTPLAGGDSLAGGDLLKAANYGLPVLSSAALDSVDSAAPAGKRRLNN